MRKGASSSGPRRRDLLHDGLEEGVHALVRVGLGVVDDPALQRRAVDHGEVGLLVGGAQFEEEVEGLVERSMRIGVGAVDLVDDHDGAQTQAQRPHEHVAGLRHGALVGVHQQQDRVDHGEHPLHFAGEVGVAGRVDDVDEVAAPLHRAVLGPDGDAALALQVVAVHDPLFDALVLAEDPGGPEDGVDQRGLAVIDVGDDGDVADLVRGGSASVGDGGIGGTAERHGTDSSVDLAGPSAPGTRAPRRGQGIIAV